MRTTVVLNDELAAAAKRLAAERRVSFSQILHDALRRELAETSTAGEARPFSIPVFAPQDYRPADQSPAEFDQLLHEDPEGGR